jgi:hypothetical protein
MVTNYLALNRKETTELWMTVYEHPTKCGHFGVASLRESFENAAHNRLSPDTWLLMEGKFAVRRDSLLGADEDQK